MSAVARRLLVLSGLVWSCGWLAAALGAEAPFKLVLQTPPSASVDSVAVSPDGTLVATAAGEGGVRLYDAHSGALLRTIGEVGDRGVVFSPEGRTLTAAGFHMDKLVGLFDVQTGKRVLALPGHTEWEAYATALSPDGRWLASTGTDLQILVWELATGKLRHQLKVPGQKLAALVFSPDSATLASGGGDKTVQLWDMTTGQVRQSFAGHSDWICALAYSPDGKTLASASCDWGFHRGHDWIRTGQSEPEQSEWRLWDVASGKLQKSVPERGRMLSVVFAPHGKSLACAIGKDVRLYDLASDAAGRVVTSHDATITSLAFTPDGSALLTGSHDLTVKRTSLATGKLQWQAPGYYEQVNSVALSNDGSLLVTGSSDHRFARLRLKPGTSVIGPGAVRLWDVRTGHMLRRLGNPADQIMAAAVSSDGQYAAAGGGSVAGKGVVHLWNTQTGAPLWSLDDQPQEVLALAFAPDGKTLAAGAAEGIVKIRDVQTGRVVQTLPDHQGGATSVLFTRDGATLYCGQGHGGVRIWDARSGRLQQTCGTIDSRAHQFTIDRLINSIGVSRDGTMLAVCNSSINNEFVDSTRIWDPRSGALIRDFSVENIHGRPMALSPDGSILATGGKAVQLWDVRTGQKLRKLYGHLKRTQSITFSADGRLVVSGGSYGTTNLWDVATGRHLVTLFAFSGSTNGEPIDDWLAYAPDGTYDGSQGVEKYLSWRHGAELLTPATLDRRSSGPHPVKAALRLELSKLVSP